MNINTKVIEKYKAFDLLDEGVQVLDKDWNYLYVNEAVALQAKSTVDELLSTSLTERIPGVEKTPWFATLSACMRSRSSRKFHNEFEYPDGTKGWFDLSIKPVEEGLLILSVEIGESLYNQKFKDYYNELVLKSDHMSEIGYWEMVTATQKLFVSDNWLNIFGLTREEFEGTVDVFIESIHPQDLDHFNTEIQKAHEQKKNIPIDFRIVRHNDGAVRNVQAVGQFQFDEEGNIVRDVGFIQDITQTVEAQKSEHKVLNLLSSILDQSMDMIFSIDTEYRLVEANPIAKKRIKELTGVEIKPGINMIYDFSKAVEETWKPHMDRALKGEQFSINEKGASTNREFYTHSSFNPIWDGKNIVGVSIFSRDTTKETIASQKLENQEEIFKQLISQGGHLSGQEYFNKIVLLLTELLNADYCMLGEKIPENKVKTIAWCVGNVLQEEVEYELKGTPCDTALAKSVCVIEESAYSKYPEDKLLEEMQVESYIGVPIFNSQKKYIGILNVMFKRKITETSFITSLLEMISMNVAFELQRLESELRLRESKNYLENLLDTIKGFVVVFDKQGNIQKINKAGLELSGYTQEEILGKNWFDTLVPRERYPELVKKLEFPAPRRSENPIVTKSGKELIIEWHNSEIVEDGEISGTVSFGLDITQRKIQSKILSAAMQDRDNFREALNNSALVSITDLKGKIIYANDKFVEISKYSREELIGQDHRVLSSKFHDKEFWNDMWRTIGSGKPWKREVKNKAKDGSFYWVDTNINAVYNDDEEVYQYMSVRYDITEKKQWEQDLIESESNLKAIFDNSAENILSLDRQFRVLAFNEKAASSLKKRFNIELKNGLNIIEALPKEMREEALRECSRALKGEHFILERQYKKAHSSLFMEVSYSPIYSNGIISGITLSSRNITDKKLSEEAMQKMDKLHSIGTLAGGIAHDFNNVLLGISANISMLQSKLPKGSDGFEYIDESILAMKRASSLTKQLLTFSKGGEPIKEDVNIQDLITNVVKFDLSGSNVKPDFEFEDELWMAKVDRGQIQQVISNLTINADQAMPDGGRLKIQARNLDLDSQKHPSLKPGPYIEIIVEDNGTGIKEELADQIFDPYFSTKELGHGLGLATSYSIIIKHNGFIKVDSEYGKGTTFIIYLPANPKAKKVSENGFEIMNQRTKASGKILIMDDVEMLRKVMTNILKEEGYEVSAVEEGQEAINLYKEHFENGQPFDALIMDMTIPGGMGGAEAIGEIKKIDPNVKAIASSGYSNHQAMSDFENFGFKSIIEKPYTNDQLLKVLEDVLNGSN